MTTFIPGLTVKGNSATTLYYFVCLCACRSVRQLVGCQYHSSGISWWRSHDTIIEGTSNTDAQQSSAWGRHYTEYRTQCCIQIISSLNGVPATARIQNICILDLAVLVTLIECNFIALTIWILLCIPTEQTKKNVVNVRQHVRWVFTHWH